MGLVDRHDGLQPTPKATLVLDELDGFERRLDLLERLDEAAVDLPLDALGLEAFEDCEVHRATEASPMAPMLRLAELTMDAGRARVLSGAVEPHSYDVALGRAREGELAVDLVLSSAAADEVRYSDWYAENLADDLKLDELDVRVAKSELPNMGVLDDVVCIGRDESQVSCVVTVADERVRDWAVSVFSDYFEDAVPATDYFDDL
ncbi:MAG: hypothetical protein ACLFMT_04010 [Halobacteriales archaeon]